LIEQALYFALGFLVAGLFMLMFLPAFWRRAMRLSMRRLQMLAPMSMEEVVAERDLLRADFAVRERRLEQEMAAIKDSRAHDLADIGRHAARIADLDGQLQRAVTYSRDVEMQLRDGLKTIEERTDLLSSTEMALHEMTERAERGVEQARRLETDKAELGRQTEIVQTRVVAHEAKIGALHGRNTELERDLEKLREEFARVSLEAARLPGIEADLTRTAADLDRTHEEKGALATALDETREALTALQQRRALEIGQLENALRLARAEARDHADRLEITRADNSMLQGAVEALRKEHAALRQAKTALAAAAAAPRGNGEALDARDVEALRREITLIGARMEEIAAEPPSKRAQ
jgi:chromosome segregation ATPase